MGDTDVSGLNFHEILSNDNLSAEVLPGALGPHFFGNRRIIGWNQMCENKGFYSGFLRYPPHIDMGCMGGDDMFEKPVCIGYAGKKSGKRGLMYAVVHFLNDLTTSQGPPSKPVIDVTSGMLHDGVALA
jgi:hypothetical protein